MIQMYNYSCNIIVEGKATFSSHIMKARDWKEKLSTSYEWLIV